MSFTSGYRLSVREKQKAIKKRSLAVLCARSVRFRMAIAFLICLCSVICCNILLSLVFYLVLGQNIYDLSQNIIEVIDYSIIIASFVLTLPLLHGYKHMAATAIDNENVNLQDLFYFYTDFRMCIKSFFISLLSLLSIALPPAEFYACFYFRYKFITIPVCLLLALPWYRLTTRFRLLSSIHAANPGLSFSEMLGLTGKGEKKNFFRLELSFISELALTVITLFIFGIYRTFAYMQISEELYASLIMKNKNED